MRAAVDCWRCTNPEQDVVWANERWVLTSFEQSRLPFGVMLMPREHLDLGDLDDAMAAELGVLSVRMVRAVEALDAVGRVHLYSSATAGRTCTRSCSAARPGCSSCAAPA